MREAVRKYFSMAASNQNTDMIFFDATKFREGIRKTGLLGMVYPLRHKMKCRLDRDN